jgi:hypothetical protein
MGGQSLDPSSGAQIAWGQQLNIWGSCSDSILMYYTFFGTPKTMSGSWHVQDYGACTHNRHRMTLGGVPWDRTRNCH